MDAFDADVLIYAAAPDHPLGRRVAALFPSGRHDDDDPPVGVGSVLLMPELLAKPIRDDRDAETDALAWLLGRLDLRPVDPVTAGMATVLGVEYGLRAVDAVHLATALNAGAHRFLTNNRDDFPRTISEIDITYPDALAEPAR